MKHLHRDPSWRCRDQDFPHSGLSQGSAERQREEGLRAFNLLVAGVKPPDLGGTTFTVGPVQVLGSWFCSLGALRAACAVGRSGC